MDEKHPNAGYAEFLEALGDGRLQPGQNVTQAELCDILGLSLSPLRETTTLLEAAGLITVRRHAGIKIFYPDINFIGQTFQFRGVIERAGVRKFADVVSADWITEMRERHAVTMAFVRDRREPNEFAEPVRRLEVAFHDPFVRSLNNDLMLFTHARLDENLYIVRRTHTRTVSPKSTLQALTEHLAVVTALEQHDADAAEAALEAHFRSVLHRVFAE